jgi:hypothetical protein
MEAKHLWKEPQKKIKEKNVDRFNLVEIRNQILI